jgi:transcriptional regulator with XRE-family HTH domain
MLRIRFERLRRSLTIEQVADATSISTVQLSWIERGRLLPLPEQREALAAFYSLPGNVLFAPMPEPEQVSAS